MRVFVSYRRDDSSGHTGRLRDRLRSFYGFENVFQDVDSIEAGESFGDTIGEALELCDVLLVVIGPTWLDTVDVAGRRRLDDPADWVALEVATGLNRDGLRVIPVLVDGASMPAAADLPESIRGLASRNAFELHDEHWDQDIDQLLAEIGGRRHRPLGVPRPVWAAAILALLATAGLFVMLRASEPWGTASFRVAVAEFGGESDDAARLSENLYTSLRDALADVPEVGIRGPSDVGRVRSETDAESAAIELDADVVVYGTVGDQLSPRFYLHRRATTNESGHFAGAEDLTGAHQPTGGFLSVDIPSRGLGQETAVREALTERIEALRRFVEGLSWYVLGPEYFAEAEVGFETALENAGDSPGAEVFHLFLGNIDGRRGDLPAARQHFADALALDPDYARAIVGFNEVELLGVLAGCAEPPADDLADRLDEVERGFDDALQVSAPEAADIDHKVAYAKARIHICRSQSGIADEWALAREALHGILDAYDAGTTRLTELSARALGELASVEAPLTPEATGPDSYQQSVDLVLRAIERTSSPLLEADLQRRLAFFYQRQERSDDEAEALRRAEELCDALEGIDCNTPPTFVAATPQPAETLTPDPNDPNADPPTTTATPDETSTPTPSGTSTPTQDETVTSSPASISPFSRDAPSLGRYSLVFAAAGVGSRCSPGEIGAPSAPNAPIEWFSVEVFRLDCLDDVVLVEFVHLELGKVAIVRNPSPTVTFAAEQKPVGDYEVVATTSSGEVVRAPFEIARNEPRIDVPTQIERQSSGGLIVRGFRAGRVVNVTITQEGRVIGEYAVQNREVFPLPLSSEAPLGSYTVEARQPDGFVAEPATFEITRRTFDPLEVAGPRRLARGATIELGLGGHPPTSGVEVFVARLDGDEWVVLGSLIVQTDDRGEALHQVPTAGDHVAGDYCFSLREDAWPCARFGDAYSGSYVRLD